MPDRNETTEQDAAAAGDRKPVPVSTAKRFAPRSPRAALEPERMPELATRRSKTVRHPMVVAGNAVITIFLVCAIIFGVTFAIGKQRFEAPGPLDRDRVVNIPRGTGLRDIADLLQREGVIDQPWLFIGGVLALKVRDELKHGEYVFTRQASLHQVVDTLIEGKVIQYQMTIPEGLTSEQIIARLTENDVLTGSVKDIPPEGSMLPETYKFTRGTTREQLVQRMRQAQKRVVDEIWAHRAPGLPITTPAQLVTLASIIEKETGRADERSRVAAVFVNRLRLKMKLQSDPTIIYGLVGGKGTLGRPIMRSEIEHRSAYNTYVIEGLPPGPIANPGRASLEAVANPSRTKDLYFVSDGNGGHRFAETLEQHQRNVAALRLIEQQQRESKTPKNTDSSSQASEPTAFAPVAPVPTPPIPAPKGQRKKGAKRSR